ncbi:MAG: thioredoxin domain-containing protein [Bacteroidota bacterium]
MRIKFITSALFFFSFSFIFSQIDFEKNTTLEKLKAKAKKEKKLIFIDAYTTWCGPCKWISANIFTDKKVGDYYNKNFINAKFDMEDEGEGAKIGSLYKVMCFPNLLFIDSDGKMVHRTAGAEQDPQFYIQLGEIAKSSDKNFSVIEANYLKNPSDPKLFKAYMSAVSSTCLDYKDELDKFLSSLRENDYLKEENWNVITEYLTDFNNKTTQYIAKKSAKFTEKYGDEVDGFLYNSIRQTAFDLLNEPDFESDKYNLLLQTAKTIESESVSSLLPMLEVYGYERQSDWVNLFDYLMKNGDKILDAENKNRYSYLIAENSSSDTNLKKAEQWMKEVLAEEGGENWNTLDTYSHVLFKMNRNKEALEIAEKSLKTSEELEDAQREETLRFIDEIKKSLK